MLVTRRTPFIKVANALPSLLCRQWSAQRAWANHVATDAADKLGPEDCLLLGAYEGENGAFFTQSAPAGLNLEKLLQLANMKGKPGEVRVFPVTEAGQKYQQVAVAGIGKKEAECDGVEATAEAVRTAVAAGLKTLRNYGAKNVFVDCMDKPQAAGEGAALGLYSFDRLKAEDKRCKPLACAPLQAEEKTTFDRGIALGLAQNLVRELMELPSNLLTPKIFADRAIMELETTYPGSVSVRVHEQGWAEAQGMGAFLGVAQGSDEPLRFLEIEYLKDASALDPPVVLVGKGITFDSGGISLKPSNGMGLMRADMGGAANVVGAIKGLASLGACGRVVGLVPLCENMPSGRALKPGDVVTASNGLTVEVEDTDAEGRLILADALVYACKTYQPRALLSIATLTGAIDVALGSAATGVFTKSDDLWRKLENAGYIAGERLWRMPTYKQYEVVLDSCYADLNNTGGRMAGSCTAAAFLRKFVTMGEYAHLDIAGVMHAEAPHPGVACDYLGKGMQGRPVRALIEYLLKTMQV